jgi:choline dehydrogenase
VDRLAEGYRVALEVSNAPELRALCAGEPPDELREDVALRHRLVENAYSIPHVVGTCRMGSSPADGAVVDAAGCVHGVVGLSVVDASIIPEPPSGFPHLITLMIAQHLMSRRNRGGASA